MFEHDNKSYATYQLVDSNTNNLSNHNELFYFELSSYFFIYLNDDLYSHNQDKDGDQNTMSSNGQHDENDVTQLFPQYVYHQLYL